VDRAIDCLRDAGIPRGCVNAGGDLRVLGREAARVQLEPRHGDERCVPVLEVANGSVASSGGGGRHREAVGPHVHGIARHAVGGHAFVSVVADRCVVADALTKVVLAQGPRSEAVLRRYRATAHVRTARHEWQTIGGTTP
jgi:FAD:protein FMN transferase